MVWRARNDRIHQIGRPKPMTQLVCIIKRMVRESYLLKGCWKANFQGSNSKTFNVLTVLILSRNMLAVSL